MAAKLQNPAPSILPFSTAAAQLNPVWVTNNPPPPRTAAIHTSQSSLSSPQSNPFATPTHSPQNSNASDYSAFSPISPIEGNSVNSYNPSASQRLQSSSETDSMPTDPHRSVDLRKLDGKPYSSNGGDEAKSQKVKVAQDMYAGAMPPGYDRQDLKDQAAARAGHPHNGACHKCQGHNHIPSHPLPVKSEKPSKPQSPSCQKCGGHKSTPPSSFPRGAMANARAAPRAGPISSSEAGPSNAPAPAGHPHKCGKCGRRRRPESISTDASSQPQSPRQPGASFQNLPQIRTNGVSMVGINIEPPTAVTERAPTLPFSPASTTGERPLIQPTKREHKPSRSGSMSSLFRSLSRRRKSPENSVPSVQISKETHGGDARYSRLGPENVPQRSASPFSFVDKPQEEQTFEMNDMRKSKQPEKRNSWDKTDESTQFLAEASDRPRYSRSQSTRTGVKPGQLDPTDTYLALPADQRPGVTRFKSLRAGVNKAAGELSRSASQISRSTSLRRLESVKRVPQLWYRDDMAIEGTQGEYNSYAY